MDDDLRKKNESAYCLGSNLELLSGDELSDLVSALGSEIQRVEEEIARKRLSLDAANSIFDKI